ncbi:MAG: Cell shape determining protein, MreB/Mrl family [Parcubacteria group bacterium GW2011_GWC1_43_11b]|uniref:Cell shape-determining protein MreB n=2 Tax=Candidatus Vogeliibacteriota TaxID=1817922 RepID=A0A1G2QFA1_9BACT|nr:MAG: Cell shape determining protein, MreB/Mrl family [Parcubacteria group bacterium GW2011_GWB1_42_9]KKS89493.1 MAG: Cell shape determining protein, MreB/Mrl family [Parcubacteria group bacterium GW2011_GWC1_43_11b]KKT10152.1 MAG: Cell shape determining protein, MreB/Mrl family [Parcubacteria group bacterium GW2011_GWA1_43_21]OHA59058.1 MAG: rod shape-determining protein [Candidatus Vogelbacteria bacterium RIFOXYB1_FULL_42_16]OHA60355.1 MAG: rod shape-determining protein [Candidatus Vogelbac
MFSSDIGIDLGTATTLVYVRGQGIVAVEPSIVAINQKTGRVVAVGNDASQMIGRTPAHISAIKPLVNGVVSNFEVAEEMLAYFIRRALERSTRKFFRPRLVIGVPSDITNVERRAVRDAAKNAGAREVHIIEEPMAASLGIRLPIYDPVGSMIIDIGGGTTDIAVISLGGIVKSKNLHVAGEKLNQDIIAYVRDEFKILLGEKTAEDVKVTIGSVYKFSDSLEATIRGRDLVTGLPREVVITDSDIREAIASSIAIFVDAVKEVLESTPPEVISDIMLRGIVVVGGGARMRGLKELLEKELEIPIHIVDDPITAVVRGAGVILEDVERYRDILIDNEDELPPR